MTVNDYDQEKWVELYRAAMLEFEHSPMAGRLADARAEIAKRLEKIQETLALHLAERQAIEDALTGLRVVEEEDARHSEAAAQSSTGRLEKLQAMKPQIERAEI